MSNPAVFGPTRTDEKADKVQKTINLHIDNLYTQPGRTGPQFYGYLKNGYGHSYPDVIPLPGFP